MALQFVIGCLVLRWRHGYNAIKFISQEINKFLSYSLDGGALLFGNPTFVLHPFAMIVSVNPGPRYRYRTVIRRTDQRAIWHTHQPNTAPRVLFSINMVVVPDV
jgi:hypothetical protein